MKKIKLINKLLIAIMIGSILASCKNETEKYIINKKESSWQVVQVKDKFGDIVENESAIAAQFKGTMTNSTIADASLTVLMQIKDSTIFTIFYEYNNEPQAELPDSKSNNRN